MGSSGGSASRKLDTFRGQRLGRSMTRKAKVAERRE